MIAKYNHNYFCIDTSVKPIEIWRYEQIEGFERKVTRRGTIYYSKFLDISEIEEIFNVGFSALWNGEWCGFDISFDTNEIEVYSNNPSFAQENGMKEVERCHYKLIMPISSISEFKIIYKDSKENPTRYEIISLKELKVLWKQFKTDLLPH